LSCPNTETTTHQAIKLDAIPTLQDRERSGQEIVVEQADTVRRSLRRAADGADFADALIKERGVDAGCERTVTFDRKAAKAAGMDLLG
jgi:predicted nucleic-acid-binding protein